MKLTLSIPKVLGARIEPGESKDLNSPCGVGDSILIDFKNSIYAVADSPDWNPTASRIYLSRFSNIIEEIFILYPEARKGSIERQSNIIIDQTNRLVKEIDRKYSTAFSSIIIMAYRGKLKGLIFHCGDCYVYKINIRQRDIIQVSRTNMNYVGRSEQISQVELIDIDKNDRFVLCTDGVQALSRNAYCKSINHILLHASLAYHVHDIPDVLFDYYGKDIEMPDDMAVMVMNPHELKVANGKLIIGGVTSNEIK